MVGDTQGTPLPPPIRQSSIASTCYPAGGVPLAFTQEDLLVIISLCSKSYFLKFLDSLQGAFARKTIMTPSFWFLHENSTFGRRKDSPLKAKDRGSNSISSSTGVSHSINYFFMFMKLKNFDKLTGKKKQEEKSFVNWEVLLSVER